MEPTTNPTKYPTNHLTSIIDIKYIIKNFTKQNIDKFNNEKQKIIALIIDTLSTNYLDINYGIEYRYFVIDLIAINGFNYIIMMICLVFF